MLGREVNELEEISANQLSMELRLLHNICGRILFPKTGRFDFISERDIVLMDCILNGFPLNLPGMMISYMGEACTKKKVSLPYGMILTLIFEEQRVQIPKNEPKKLLRHTDFYNESTLHRMGYKKVNGAWEKKGQEGQMPFVDMAGPSAVPASSPGTASPPPVASSSAPPPPAPAAVTDGLLEKIREVIREENAASRNLMKDIVKSELEESKEMIKGLDERLRDLEVSYQISVMGFKGELEEISKKLNDIADGSDAYATTTANLQAHIDKSLRQIEEMFTHFRKTQKEGMGAILERLKRILG